MRHSAFTLIETLLSTAIMGMMLVFGFLTAYSIITRSEKIFQQQALLINQNHPETLTTVKMDWMERFNHTR